MCLASLRTSLFHPQGRVPIKNKECYRFFGSGFERKKQRESSRQRERERDCRSAVKKKKLTACPPRDSFYFIFLPMPWLKGTQAAAWLNHCLTTTTFEHHGVGGHSALSLTSVMLGAGSVCGCCCVEPGTEDAIFAGGYNDFTSPNSRKKPASTNTGPRRRGSFRSSPFLSSACHQQCYSADYSAAQFVPRARNKEKKNEKKKPNTPATNRRGRHGWVHQLRDDRVPTPRF